MDEDGSEETRVPRIPAGPVRGRPVPETPRWLRRLRWPLSIAFLATLAAFVFLAGFANAGLLDADGPWISSLLLLLGVLGLSTWTGPSPYPPRPRHPRM